uniref:FH2 domain-containing protein n=1 Tax=Alexandrium monilatum TaxID=311494 RepID=A0A6T1LHX8_9DINO|mmetsp:Transcript_72585/g.216645  ORF Transcript_72585/g.216645 Transcript_72585/m.216645 type:complete len:829 (+) Transcript_72585:52-2538(+)
MAPPGRPKAPPPPPPSAKAAAVCVAAPEPRKPVIVPEREMKPLRWKRLQLGQHFKEGVTVWDSVPELPADEELTDQLLRLFCKAVPVARAPSIDSNAPMNSERGSEAGEPKELHIIQGTIQRCGREGALAKLPPAAHVASALRQFDHGALLEGAPEGMQLCEVLRLVHDNACPTPVQQQKLEEARGRNPDQPLGNIERYMWEVSRVPAYNERLECWLYLSTWEEDLRPVRSNIEQFETILGCFRSTALPQLLGVVLTVGNYLNGGTKDGRADGFNLNLLRSGGIDSVRDNQSSGNLRRFVISTWLDKCRKGAAALLVDLRPALKNVKRTLEGCSGGGLRLQKQVKVSLERTCDEALSRLQAEFAEKLQMLQVVKGVTLPDSPTAVRMQSAFDTAQQRLGELQRMRDRAADRYTQLLGWLHHNAREPSEAFLMLWDDFLIPAECFEAQGPSKVKSMLKPIFCDDSVEIDVYGLGRLWEVNVGGLTARSRSTSATPRGRCSSQGPGEGGRGRPASTSSWQDWRRQPSREKLDPEVSSPSGSARPEGWPDTSSAAPTRASPTSKDSGLPPRPRQSSRNPSPCRRCFSTSLGGDQPVLSRARTSPELGISIEESAGEPPNEPTTPGTPPVVPSLKDRFQRLTAGPDGPGSARNRGSESPVPARDRCSGATIGSPEEDQYYRLALRHSLDSKSRGIMSSRSVYDLLGKDKQSTTRPMTHRGSTLGDAISCQVTPRGDAAEDAARGPPSQLTGGGQLGLPCGPPPRAVRGRTSSASLSGRPSAMQVTPPRALPPPPAMPPATKLGLPPKGKADEDPPCCGPPPRAVRSRAVRGG